MIGILVIFLGTKEAFLVTGSLVPQWRFDATRLELDSNQPVCLRAPEQISPVEKNSHAMLVNKLEIGIAVSQSVSQIGSQLLPPVSLTGHETGVFQPAFRVWPADPWSATFLANRLLRNIYK